MKQLLFVYNPNAGSGRLGADLMDIECALAGEGYLLTVCPTTAPGDARRFAAEYGPGNDVVVCAGGDGTLNEVVNGLLHKAHTTPPIGYIPCGTTNDYAASLSIPQGDLMEAVERLLYPNEIFHCDVGIFGDRIFNYVAAFGAFTDVAYATNQNVKNLMGYFAYVLEALSRLPKLHPLPARIECDGDIYEGDFLFGVISNSTSVGGFSFNQISPKVHMNDGLFEVLLVRHPQNLGDLGKISRALITRKLESDLLVARHASTVRVFTQDAIPWTLDGEYGGETTRAHITLRPGAVAVCT